MNTTDHVHTEMQDDLIELGVASVDTHGTAGMRIEPLGFVNLAGISDD